MISNNNNEKKIKATNAIHSSKTTANISQITNNASEITSTQLLFKLATLSAAATFGISTRFGLIAALFGLFTLPSFFPKFSFDINSLRSSMKAALSGFGLICGLIIGIIEYANFGRIIVLSLEKPNNQFTLDLILHLLLVVVYMTLIMFSAMLNKFLKSVKDSI